MTRALPVVVLLLAGITALPAKAEQVIDQKDKRFSQDAVTVKAGETVTFTNSDQVSHDVSVKNPDGSRQSSTMQKPGDKQSVTFDKPGSYQVQCLIHPKMKMTVTAQ
jgi:plastocyanin